MKYFTRELWALINSGDTKNREDASKQWSENLHSYEIYKLSIKKRKINRFLEKLNQHDNLHDYDVKSITYDVCKNTCDIEVCYCGKKFALHFFGVSSLQADMRELDMDFPKLRWGYHEIEQVDNKKWRFSVVFDMENELQLVSKGARFAEIDKVDTINC